MFRPILYFGLFCLVIVLSWTYGAGAVGFLVLVSLLCLVLGVTLAETVGRATRTLFARLRGR